MPVSIPEFSEDALRSACVLNVLESWLGPARPVPTPEFSEDALRSVRVLNVLESWLGPARSVRTAPPPSPWLNEDARSCARCFKRVELVAREGGSDTQVAVVIYVSHVLNIV